MDKWLGMTEVAKATRISRWTIRYWLRQGEGPPFKQTPGGRYLFRKQDVLEWLFQLRGTAVIHVPRAKQTKGHEQEDRQEDDATAE